MKDGKPWSETPHPFKIDLPIQAKDIPRVDAVLYTHADMDHFAIPTAETLQRMHKPLFVGTPPVVEKLKEIGVAEEQIKTARDFSTIKIGDVEIEVSPALHDYPNGGWQRGDACGYVFRTPDGSVWHPGDTRLIDELKQIKDIDVLLFDVADVTAHLGPEGSAALAMTCGAKVLFAYHYGTYEMPPGTWGGCDPEDCSDAVKGLLADFRVLNPGELLRLPLSI